MLFNFYWHRLIDHYNSHGYIQNGLTIPYIIGSRTILEPDQQLQSVPELLHEISTAKLYLSVLRCDTLGELVFNFSSISDYNIYGGFDNIVDIDSRFTKFPNLEEFALSLQNEYSDLIKAKRFSRDRFGKWNQFNKFEDIPRLNEIL